MMNGTIEARTVLGIIRDREEHLKHLKDEKMIKEMEIAELNKAIAFLEGNNKPVAVTALPGTEVSRDLAKATKSTKCDFPGCSSSASPGHGRCEVHFYKHSPEKKTTGDTLEELV